MMVWERFTEKGYLSNDLKKWERDLCTSGGKNTPDRAKQPVKRLPCEKVSGIAEKRGEKG